MKERTYTLKQMENVRKEAYFDGYVAGLMDLKIKIVKSKVYLDLDDIYKFIEELLLKQKEET